MTFSCRMVRGEVKSGNTDLILTEVLIVQLDQIMENLSVCSLREREICLLVAVLSIKFAFQCGKATSTYEANRCACGELAE